MRGKINYVVFLPSALIFLVCIVLNIFNGEAFAILTTEVYYWILDKLGWLFLLTTVVVLLACLWVCFTPLGNVVIGGKKAVPLLNKWNWFSITICTTVAAGIVFWGAAEPVQHILNPPISAGIEAMTPKAAIFAMSTIYTHWTFLPYGLYTILTVMFAFSYYNMKKPFSLGSTISPIVSNKYVKLVGTLVDNICIFSLVAGLAASLGIGVLNISGGLVKLFGITSNAQLWMVIVVVVGGTSIISAVTGISKGIKILSNLNIYVYGIIILFVLLFGGTVFIFGFGIEGLGDFFSSFFSKAMFTGTIAKDSWAKDWPMFYFGNWMAWAPITAVFLGRISYGRKIKEVVLMNLLVTGSFSIIWFMVISGATTNMLMNNPGSGVIEAFQMGYENVIYQVFNNLPLSQILIPLYLFAVFISFVTAADSTTVAIAGLCSKGIAPDSPEAPKSIKIIWGIIIIFITLIMMNMGDGITGVKMLSNIGGLPAMLLVIAALVAMIKVSSHPNDYSKVE